MTKLTYMLEDRVNIRVVLELMGHANVVEICIDNGKACRGV